MSTTRRAVLFATIVAIGLTVTVNVAVARDQAALTKALVEKAVDFYQAKSKETGKDQTLKVMNSMPGATAVGLRKGPLYVFGVDMSNGRAVIMITPANRKLIGKDLTDLKGAKGKQFLKEMMKVANSESGSGWVEYWWLRNGETEPTLKRSYIMKVPDEPVLLGAGYYIK